MKTNRTTELKHDTLRFFRINIFLLVLFTILNAFTSCSSEDNGYVDPEEQFTSPLLPETLGVYQHHTGELNKGTVLIEPDRIEIETQRLNQVIDLRTMSVEIVPDCYVILTMSNGYKLNISFFPAIERLHIDVIDSEGNEVYYGTFDKVKLG